ncbi:hypothetical protein F0U44_12275 [Nocardioides humilatus]|uniref:Uncharacterized protein n=1 Tax=Nocardioides humilatus TaxID=2607660 RepID=A0A5B1LHV1_9ACTN|nr:hypothetical protein [Nocardioides humilatus]KAA1419219.1 hypothetical protein F0U44_12275 [Nocardioides humilatus]
MPEALMSHRRTRLLIAIPSAALIAVSLVGCGDAIKDKVEKDLKEQGVDADLDDLEDGQINIDTTDGGISTGELPKDFPTDEVPIVDGEILGGTYTKNPATWNVTIKVDGAGGDKNAAFDDAADKLSGLENPTAKTDNGTSIFGQYISDSYVIDLAVTDSNGVVVNYTVAPK